jgi:hypothetical protein
MSDGDKDLPAQDQFVENWLMTAKSDFPKSGVLASIVAATKSAQLDETKLTKQLLELSKPAKKVSDGPA